MKSFCSKKRLYLLTIISVLFILNLTGCKKIDANKQSHANKGTRVVIKNVLQADVPLDINSFGIFKASNNVDIKPMISGQISKVCFSEGTEVHKGQLLFKIDPRQYKADVMNDKAALEKSIALMKMKKLLVDENRSIAKNGAMAAQTYDKIVTDLAVAKAEVDINKYQLKSDEINLQYCSIYSPIDGVIGLNNTGVGNIVDPDTTLANIKTINPLKLKFNIPESNVEKLQKALSLGKLTIYAYISEESSGDSDNKREFTGYVKSLNNTVNSASSTVTLNAIFPNADKKLLPGMYAAIQLIISIQKNALLIPKDAVKFGQNNEYIFVVNSKNCAEKVNVTTGQVYENNFVVTSGRIKKGDKVIVSGLLGLNSGDPVQIINNNYKSGHTKL